MTDVYWKAHPGPQTAALESFCFETMYGGARGGGKTDGGLAWLTYDVTNPLFRALIIRKNADDLADWLDRATRFYRSSGGVVVGKPAQVRFPSGALFRIGHLKDDKAYTKYLGHEYQRLLVEELTLIEHLEDYLKLISCCRSTVRDLPARVFATTNPGGPGHGWVKDRFVDVARPGEIFLDPVTGRTRIFIPAKVTDNPTLVREDPAYVEFLNGLPDDLKRAWRDGDWDVFEGQFFSKFRREVHVVTPRGLPPEWGKAVGIDWGYDPHPCTVAWWAKSFEGPVYKYREAEFFETSPREVARQVMKLSEDDGNVTMWVGGHDMWVRNPFAGGMQDTFKAHTDKSIADSFTNEGIPLLMANTDRMNGWQLIKTLMEWEGTLKKEGGGYDLTRRPQMYIFSSCLNTVKAYPVQIHDPVRGGDMKKKDGDDHPDADRYALMHLLEGEPPLEEKTVMEKFLERERQAYAPGVIMAEEESSGGQWDS